MREFDTKHRGLQRVEPEITADELVKVLRIRSVIAKDAQVVVGQREAVSGRCEIDLRDRLEEWNPLFSVEVLATTAVVVDLPTPSAPCWVLKPM